MSILLRSKTCFSTVARGSIRCYASRKGTHAAQTWREKLTSGTTLTFLFLGSTLIACNLYFLSDKRKRNHNDSLKFRSYKLVAKEPLSSTLSVFTFRPRLPPPEAGASSTQYVPAITSLEIKQPLLQIARAYTPLPARSLQEAKLGDVRFLIRQEPHGEVSGYLNRLPVDAPARESAAEIRGPFTEFVIPEDTKEILFLAGGTGVAPAIQLAAAVSSSSEMRASLNIFWANRRKEDQKDGGIFRELQRLKRLYDEADGNKLTIDRFVDEDGSFITKSGIQGFLNKRKDSGQAITGRKIILISGPDGFVKYLAGSIRLPGTLATHEKPIDGILSTMDLQGWEVIKL